MKVKTILVSQPEPSSEKSPYKRLQEKLKLTVDFRPFIHVEGVNAKEVRQQKIDFNNFDNVILTSRNAVDNYFRLCKEMRFVVPDSTKYFCLSEAVAYYLQKYVVYRKRKVYVGEGKIIDLESVFKKFEKESFLFPTSDLLKSGVPDFLDQLLLNWQRAILYRTVVSDLSDLRDVYYDVLAFFSPSGIESLFKNFPDFKQNKTRIAAYGNTTIKAAEEHKIKRIIFASSIHSVGMYKANQNIDHKVMHKPDTFYGLSKSFGENLAQMYWDKCGIESLCIRILSCAKVTSKRSLSTWLSYDDLIRIVIKSIKLKKLGFEIIYGVSNNKRSTVNNKNAIKKLNFKILDNAEKFSNMIEKNKEMKNKPGDDYLGGPFSVANLESDAMSSMKIVSDKKKIN